VKVLGVTQGSVVKVLWHPKLNQIFTGRSGAMYGLSHNPACTYLPASHRPYERLHTGCSNGYATAIGTGDSNGDSNGDGIGVMRSVPAE
jgi:hypothetical protein